VITVPKRTLPFDEQVAAHYEQWYATAKGAHFDSIEKQMLQAALSVVKNGSLLEVGCGTGHFARFFADLGFDVAGLDVSVPMLAIARSLGGGIEYIDADAHSLPFATGCFDVVALVSAAEFLEQPMKALEEALRVAKKLVVIGFLNRYSLTAMRRRARGLFKKGLFSAARFYTVGEMMHLIKVAGVKSGTTLEFLRPQASWLNIGRLRLGAFAVVSARLPGGA